MEKVGRLFVSADAAFASISFLSLVKVMVAPGLAELKSLAAFALFAACLTLSSALRK
jgi:hypothetical protein